MKENIVKDKSFKFAARIINLYKYLAKKNNEYVLSKQILRCGTSIGAMIREAEQAESKADFIHKLSISLKEANETEYWLLLLVETDYIEKKMFDSLFSDNKDLIKLITTIIKSTKKNIQIN